MTVSATIFPLRACCLECSIAIARPHPEAGAATPSPLPSSTARRTIHLGLTGWRDHEPHQLTPWGATMETQSSADAVQEINTSPGFAPEYGAAAWEL